MKGRVLAVIFKKKGKHKHTTVMMRGRALVGGRDSRMKRTVWHARTSSGLLEGTSVLG
jgi:hypothetical protein